MGSTQYLTLSFLLNAPLLGVGIVVKYVLTRHVKAGYWGFYWGFKYLQVQHNRKPLTFSISILVQALHDFEGSDLKTMNNTIKQGYESYLLNQTTLYCMYLSQVVVVSNNILYVLRCTSVMT